MSSLLHMIPGYSLYSMYGTLSSDESPEVKVRDSALAGTVTAMHFLNATHHALKVQRATLSSPVGLTRSWSRISSVARNPLALGITAAAILISQIPASSSESYRYDERMAIAHRLFNNPHYD